MKRTLLLVLVVLAYHLSNNPFEAVAQSADKTSTKLLHGILAKTEQGVPTTKFSSGAQKIYAFWKGDRLKLGDTIRIVWMAEIVGYSKNARIAESSAVAYKPDDDGIFSLARPAGGWPAGKYRAEIYVGDKLAETLKFTIEPDVTVEVH